MAMNRKDNRHLTLASRMAIDRSSSRADMSTHQRRSSPYLQPLQPRPLKSRRRTSWRPIVLLTCIITLLITQASAVLLGPGAYSNCLPASITNTPPNTPRLLQWTPLWVDAKFLEKNGGHNLNLTIYGNVSGQATQGTYPPPDSPNWDNSSIGFGKIVNISPSSNKYSTLESEFNFLSYTPAKSPPSPFCQSTVGVACPIAPNFNAAQINDTASLPAYTVGYLFNSSYAFATITSVSKIISGDKSALDIACVAVNVTPALTSTLVGVLRYVPVAILALVAMAVIISSIWSPWGTSDALRWSSNYGRDQDMLRLVTPGFGDCLQYIQFIILAGSLSLTYPGFFQPVVRQVAWSSLMFNESFVTNGPSTRNPIDGLYVTNSSYGLTRMSQLIGYADQEDVWAGTVIWTLAIIAIVIVLCQIGLAARKLVRRLSNNPAEDLRRKNWPFTGGNLVRIVCNFFLLPIVSLSMFQLVIAKESPAVVVAFAVILLVALICFGAWILYLIVNTKPRSHLFDDLPTVLLYGPLYNTYSDTAASFALVPACLTFMRGVAIGAVQQSGIAQLVILAICEVVFILMLHAFRPFHSPTSMNAFHTFFAAVRLTVVLLMVAFVPDLGVTESTKGWLGYVILLLHGIVLIFGFFLNAVQTMIEVFARLAGAGGEEGTGAASRGGLVKALGVRQLSKRERRQSFRQRTNSNAAFLTDDADAKSLSGGRSRSISASSTHILNSHSLINGHRNSDPRLSAHLDRTFTRSTSGDIALEFSNLAAANGNSRRPDLNVKIEPSDPYYRTPRPRRQTNELISAPGAKSRDSKGSGDWTGVVPSSPEHDTREPHARTESSPQNVAPAPAYMRAREGSETDLGQGHPSQDYAVREVDYYYGVRGPALASHGGTRKLKTGPADPVGTASLATGWFKGMFGGKKKETSKGFEVVRSSRAPPPRVVEEEEEGDSPVLDASPYKDGPLSPPHIQSQQEAAYVPGERTRSSLGDRESTEDELESPVERDDDDLPDLRASVLPPRAPSLEPLDSVGGLDFRPSRWSSMVSRHPSERQAEAGAASDSYPLVSHGIPRRPLPSKHDEPEAITGPFMSTSRGSVERARQSPTTTTPTSPPRVPFTSLGVDERAPRRPSTGNRSDFSIEDDRPVASGADPRDPHNLMPSYSGHERPDSFGWVNQFRASDGIHMPYLTHGGNAFAASSAEMVNATPRRSRETRTASRSPERARYSTIGRAE